MFGNKAFYNQSILKYLTLFGKLFSNIKLERENSDASVQQFQIVPIAYTPRDKYDIREDQDPEGNRQIAMQLPRMAYDLINLSYDPARQFNPIQKEAMFKVGATTGIVHYQPVPWNLEIQLYIRGRNQNDMFQIVEQILPYFTPTFNIKSVILNNSDCSIDVPISLLNIDMRDTLEGQYDNTREMIWTLTFNINGWIFGPDVSSDMVDKQIKWVSTDLSTLEGKVLNSNSYVYLANTAIEDIRQTDNYIVKTDVTSNI